MKYGKNSQFQSMDETDSIKMAMEMSKNDNQAGDTPEAGGSNFQDMMMDTKGFQ